MHRTLGEECLNPRTFRKPCPREHAIRRWLRFYNTQRPHSALGWLLPSRNSNPSRLTRVLPMFDNTTPLAERAPRRSFTAAPIPPARHMKAPANMRSMRMVWLKARGPALEGEM
ncbi:MAG: transposase [Chloroflexi bacterium]|nr:transposase [Chloroflexota bacterium]